MLEGPLPAFDGNGRPALLVSAAESVFDREGRIEGALDVPLSERGRSQARRILDERVRPLLDVRVYSAPNRSSMETAEILCTEESGRIRCVRELAGISCGLWEGLLVAELKQRHRRSFDRWAEDPYCLTPPRGEDMGLAEARITLALRAILKKNRVGIAVVVAPAPVIDVGYRHLNGVSGQAPF